MDQKNLLFAVLISLAVLVGFQYLYEKPRQERAAQQAAQTQATQQSATPTAPASPAAPGTPSVPGAAAPQPSAQAPVALDPVSLRAARQEVLKSSPRIRIKTPRLHGSIALKGARFDDLTLANYHETVDPRSPEIALLAPVGAPKAYFTEFGWTAPASANVPMPDADTVWKADGEALTPETPVTLTWDNGQGLRFSRTIAVDDNFMFTIAQKIENTGAAPVTLYPYALTSRWETPETAGFYILHEGPLAVMNNSLEEFDYDELREKQQIKKESATGGWIGITDKYWMVALIPDKNQQKLEARMSYRAEGGADKYQTDYVGLDAQTVAPGASIETKSLMFAGAKQVRLLDRYAEEYGIEKFDRAIVFRWLYFLAKPLFYGLSYIYDLTGNFGIAILVLVVFVKILFFPLANKSYRSMSRMKVLQPEMAKIKERVGDDRQKMHQEVMAMYKREKINPASGCLPVIVQIPVFFCLYEVLFVTIEMRHAPFFGWIKDLSAPDPTTLFNLFGLIPFTPPHFLMIGAWPLIMGVTMFLQQKLNPQPADPIQAKIFMFLPLIFTVMLASFPAGLVIYWAWNNILSIAQQWIIMKRVEREKARGKKT
jgi:YidC/Oxa1 family membrane protein insertase